MDSRQGNLFDVNIDIKQLDQQRIVKLKGDFL
jgi:hypothetical protein